MADSSFPAITSATLSSALLSLSLSLFLNIPPVIFWLIYEYRRWKTSGQRAGVSYRQHCALMFVQSQVYYISEVFQSILALVGSVLYVVSTYVKFDSYVDCEVALITFFTCDYILLFGLAEDKRSYVLNPFGLLDMFIVIVMSVFFVLKYSFPQSVLIDLIRIAAVFRIIRFGRLLKWFPPGFYRELARLVFIIFVNLYIFATIVWAVENLGDPGQWDNFQALDWHESFYFMVVTFATVGYGDLAPRTVLGRYSIVVMVVIALIIIPLYGNVVAEAARTTPVNNRYLRGAALDKHVIVMGDISFLSLRAFLNEFFHSDHGYHDHHVVILSEEHPRPEMVQLLRVRQWEQRVQYLQGSALIDHDLARAGVTEAAAVFVTTRKFTNDAVDADGETVLRVLSVRTRARSIPVFVQLRRPAAAFYIQERVDHILPLDRIKSAALAQSCLCPGLVCMLSNIVRTQTFDPVIAESSEPWLREYAHGMALEIYRVPFAAALVGLPFNEAVAAVFRQCGLVVLAVESVSSDHGTQLLLNPGKTYILGRGDFAMVFASNIKSANSVSTLTSALDPGSVVARPKSDPAPLYRAPRATRPSALADQINVAEARATLAPASQLSLAVVGRPVFTAVAAAPPKYTRMSSIGSDSTTSLMTSPTPSLSVVAAIRRTVSQMDPAHHHHMQRSRFSNVLGSAPAMAMALMGGTDTDSSPDIPSGRNSVMSGGMDDSDMLGAPLTQLLRSPTPVGIYDPASQQIRPPPTLNTGTSETSSPELLPIPGPASIDALKRPLTDFLTTDDRRSSDPDLMRKTLTQGREERLRRLCHEMYGGDAAIMVADAASLLLGQDMLPAKGGARPGYAAPRYASEATRSRTFRPTGPTMRIYALLDRPRTAADVVIDHFRGQGHIVVCGVPPGVLNFMLPLRLRKLPRNPPVVFLTPTYPSVELLSELCVFADVFVIVGWPRSRDDLLAAGVMTAQSVVVLAQSAADRGQDELLVDKETLLASLLIKSINAGVHLITELVKPANLRFLSPQETGESDFTFSPYYAAGFVWDSAVLDALLVQAFFNPQIMRTVELLLSGSDGVSAATHTQLGIQQVPVPPAFVGRPFLDLFTSLVTRKGVVCIGLLRGHPHPYVCTAPAPDAIIRRTDRVFVVLPHGARDEDPASSVELADVL